MPRFVEKNGNLLPIFWKKLNLMVIHKLCRKLSLECLEKMAPSFFHSEDITEQEYVWCQQLTFIAHGITHAPTLLYAGL